MVLQHLADQPNAPFGAILSDLIGQQVEGRLDDGPLEGESPRELVYRADSVSFGFPILNVDNAEARFVFAGPSDEARLQTKLWLPAD